MSDVEEEFVAERCPATLPLLLPETVDDTLLLLLLGTPATIIEESQVASDANDEPELTPFGGAPPAVPERTPFGEAPPAVGMRYWRVNEDYAVGKTPSVISRAPVVLPEWPWITNWAFNHVLWFLSGGYHCESEMPVEQLLHHNDRDREDVARSRSAPSGRAGPY